MDFFLNIILFPLDLSEVLPKSFEALNTTLYDMEDTTAVIRGHCSTYSFNPSSYRQLDEIMVSLVCLVTHSYSCDEGDDGVDDDKIYVFKYSTCFEKSLVLELLFLQTSLSLFFLFFERLCRPVNAV